MLRTDSVRKDKDRIHQTSEEVNVTTQARDDRGMAPNIKSGVVRVGQIDEGRRDGERGKERGL
jgi:hypothetical protein